jgi:CheY-like chemotaxis protein
MKRKSPLIFVVDDDPIYHKILKFNLSANEYNNVETFNSGEDCLENIDKIPDMVILDYNMNGMNGLETLKEIKKKYKDIKVIFFTANEDSNLAQESLKVGAQEFVQKNEFAYNKIKLILKETFDNKIEAPTNGRVISSVSFNQNGLS